MSGQPQVTPSPLDGDRFGLAVARLAVPPATDVSAVRRALDAADGWDLLISRCEADDVAVAAALEATGGRLMDVHVTFGRSLGSADSSEPSEPAAHDGVRIEVATSDDADAVSALFREAFAGYSGHYHADPRLDDVACTEIYADWSGRLVRAGRPDVRTLVARSPGGDILGASLLQHEPGRAEAEGVLDAVHPAVRRRGLYGLLGRHRVAAAARSGASTLTVSTHLQNLGTCRNLERLGFTLHRAQLTFHTWRER